MQLQLIEIKQDEPLPDVDRLSDTLGYVPIDQAQELDLPPIRSDAQWWKKILTSRTLGSVVDAEVDTDAGALESNDRAQILESIEHGGVVYYVTFVHRIDGHPVFFSLYQGGQLALSPEDQPYLKSIGSWLPT